MGRHRSRVIPGVLIAAALGVGPVLAQEGPAQAPPDRRSQAQSPPPAPTQSAPASEVPLVELDPLLRRVERTADKRFLVDRVVGQRIFLAGVEENEVTYPVLLSILRANNLAAVEIGGRVNIVPVHEIRNQPLPMVQSDDSSIAADEWVTRVLTPTNVQAASLVPVLRPLLPQWAHLAAIHDQNKLIVIDRYANVRRITELVRSLDIPPSD